MNQQIPQPVLDSLHAIREDVADLHHFARELSDTDFRLLLVALCLYCVFSGQSSGLGAADD